jgi:hypothetical protein
MVICWLLICDAQRALGVEVRSRLTRAAEENSHDVADGYQKVSRR